MTKFLPQLLVVVALTLFAPVAHASLSLADQRQEVFDALDVVIGEFDAEIAIVEDLLDDPGLSVRQRRALSLQLLKLNARKRFVERTQNRVFFFSARILNRIILRYDLPVSLS